MLRKASDQHIHQLLFFISFINQTSLVNIYVENATNLQSRAGRDFFGGVQPVPYVLVYRVTLCVPQSADPTSQ